MSPPPRRVGASRAFTYVEVLASLMFLAILSPVLVQGLTIANRAAVLSERKAVAAQLAENKLEELVIESLWETGNSGGDFGTDWPDYRWELKRADWDTGGITELTVTVYFEVQGREREVQLATVASQGGAR